MRPLTRIELDVEFSGGCSNPECKNPLCGEEMYIHQNCHPKAPTQTKYNRETGVLTIECMECELPVVAVKVAD